MSAVLATDFALSDHRITAAVCDGGLWNLARTRASVGWMTGTQHVMDEHLVAMHRVRLARQFKCPVLVVAGGRGTVSISEGSKLQAECAAAHIDLELTMRPMTQTPLGEIENFVTSDDYIFGWLEHKLAYSLAR
ncbi:alpha/beta hydrolase family protein [Bradyrhizobium sp. ORS 86]|uniref:alpha/beta hydrolase family protein n=1 Tax=Bradyrhizobium sp. ORS 86 TaxID=1685970 RepID=UPI00388F0CFC